MIKKYLKMMISIIIYFIVLIGYLIVATAVGLFWLIYELWNTIIKLIKVEMTIKFINKQRMMKLKKAQEIYDKQHKK